MATRRNIQLDVLRGVAILLVLGRHLELTRPGGIVGVFAEGWYRIGWLGVDLFFVLSGFLIGGLLIDEWSRHNQIDIKRFLIRRGLKIYPAYFVFLAYLIAMPMAKTTLAGGDTWRVFAEQWTLYWPNLLFLQNYVGTNPAGHTWTLAVEEHFYLILPFVLALLAATGRVRSVLILCVTVAVLGLLLRYLSVLTNDSYSVRMAATHLRIDALLFGVGIRAIAQFYPDTFAEARHWRSWLILIGVLFWMPNFFVDPGSPLIRIYGLTATYVGSAAFLLAAYHTHREDFGELKPAALRIAQVVAWVGVYSYTIYLWHVTAMGILEREFASPVMAWIGTVPGLAWTVAALGVAAGAVVVGVIASKVVEWPVLRLRDRLFPSRSVALSSPPASPQKPTPQRPRVVATPVVGNEKS